jgi:hypothetical protein
MDSSSIDINDIKAWLIQIKTELEAIPLVNRTYFENIRSTKLTRKIAEIEAYIHIHENETDLDGFISKLPKIHHMCYSSKITDIVNASYNSYKYMLVVKDNKLKSKKNKYLK